MELTLLSLFWLFSAALVLLFHFAVTLRNVKIPDVLKAAYKFGKLKNLDKIDSKTILPVPKSWFTHFYAFGVIAHSLVFILLCLHLTNVSNFFFGIKDVWRSLQWPSTRVKDNNALSVVIVFCAEWIQMSRRLYECLVTSSFSKGTMSPIHYFYGTFLYTSFGIGLLASTDVLNLTFQSVNEDAVLYLPAVILFLWASYFQHQTMQTFASLRKIEKVIPQNAVLGLVLSQTQVIQGTNVQTQNLLRAPEPDMFQPTTRNILDQDSRQAGDQPSVPINLDWLNEQHTTVLPSYRPDIILMYPQHYYPSARARN